jgi:hypothetical protein
MQSLDVEEETWWIPDPKSMAPLYPPNASREQVRMLAISSAPSLLN